MPRTLESDGPRGLFAPREPFAGRPLPLASLWGRLRLCICVGRGARRPFLLPPPARGRVASCVAKRAGAAAAECRRGRESATETCRCAERTSEGGWPVPASADFAFCFMQTKSGARCAWPGVVIAGRSTIEEGTCLRPHAVVSGQPWPFAASTAAAAAAQCLAGTLVRRSAAAGSISECARRPQCENIAAINIWTAYAR